MKNFKYIFLILLVFFSTCIFTSCKEVYLNLENINCTVDKNSYSINEDIILSFNGYFEDDIGKGNLVVDFSIYKLENDERNLNKTSSFNILDSSNLINEALYKSYFVAFIFENTTLENFSNKIIINTAEPGNYQIVVNFRGSTDEYPYGGEKLFTIDFEVL